MAIAAAALAGARAAVARAGRLPRPGAGLVLVAGLAIAPIAGFLAYSALGPELFIARYLSAALPFIVLLAGAALAWPGRAASVVAGAVAFAAVGVGAVAGLEDEHRRPDYKGAAHYIDREARPGEAVVQADLTLGATRSQVMSKGRQQSLDVNFDEPHRVQSIFQESDSVERLLRGGPRPRASCSWVRSRCRRRPPAWGRARSPRGRFPGSLPLSVRVYVPADPEAGFDASGLAAARREARLLSARAAAVGRCLREAGLGPRRAETSPPGSIALETTAAPGGRILVFVYPSPADASAALEGIERFLAAAGGQSKLLHDVVIGYTAKPAELARDRAERCV